MFTDLRKKEMQSGDGVSVHIITWVIGALIGFGQMLSAEEKHTARRIIGQSIVSGGIGASSGSLLLLFDNVPILAVLGLSAAFASIGVSAIELIIKRVSK